MWTFVGCAFSSVLNPIIGTLIAIGGIVTTISLKGHRFSLDADGSGDDGSCDGGDGDGGGD